jgi:hypothetical protein
MSGNRRNLQSLAGRSSAGRLWIVGVMLVAFAIQAFVTQTHVHPGYADSAVAFHADKTAPKHDNYPANDDPSNCPLCKEILYSGQFVSPTWAVILLPMHAVSVIETALLPVSRADTASHAWSSRAPPRI